MKLFILFLVAISVGYSEGDGSNQTPKTIPIPASDLRKLFDIKATDLQAQCGKATDNKEVISLIRRLKRKKQSKHPSPTDDDLRKAAKAVVKAALPCAMSTQVFDKVTYYMTHGRYKE